MLAYIFIDRAASVPVQLDILLLLLCIFAKTALIIVLIAKTKHALYAVLITIFTSENAILNVQFKLT